MMGALIGDHACGSTCSDEQSTRLLIIDWHKACLLGVSVSGIRLADIRLFVFSIQLQEFSISSSLATNESPAPPYVPSTVISIPVSTYTTYSKMTLLLRNLESTHAVIRDSPTSSAWLLSDYLVSKLLDQAVSGPNL
jgi:hypothetical protein